MLHSAGETFFNWFHIHKFHSLVDKQNGKKHNENNLYAFLNACDETIYNH